VTFVVVVDPGRKLLQHSHGIRSGLDARVVALQGLHEGFADAVALRAADGGEAGHEGKSGGEAQRLLGGVGRAVIGQPLHGMGRPESGEPPLDAGEHEVTDHLAADAAGAGLPGNDLPVAGVDRERDAHDLAVPTADLQPIGRPALIGRQGNDAALVRPDWSSADMRLKQ
jgi:hypothetical protein